MEESGPSLSPSVVGCLPCLGVAGWRQLAAVGCAPHLLRRPPSSAQAAFRKTLEKEAKGEEPDIPVPKFKQRKRESDGAYVQRMEQEAQHVLFLTKNQATRQPEVQAAPRKKSERKKA